MQKFDFVQLEPSSSSSQKRPTKKNWTLGLVGIIWVVFFTFFVVVTKISFEHRHFQLHVSPKSQLLFFEKELNRSFAPMHQLFSHTVGPLGILAEQIEKEMDDPLVAQVFTDQLDPSHLNATDQQMMKTINTKIDVIFDFAQSQILNLGTQAYTYLDMGQVLIKTTINYVFYGACTASIFLGIQLSIFIYYLFQ